MKQELTREEITKIQGEPLQRSMSISREMNLDEENRTVELAFSSSEPVPHWFGHLILDHSESSIRLNRLRETGALLWAHDYRIQIGAVESVSIDSDKNGDGKCRAVVKFSESECGEENFQDVKAGIKRSVSFGFLIYSLEAEPGADGKQMEIDGEYVYRSRDWEPFEVSLVSIPADTSVGVGRNLFTGEGDANQNAQTERVISKTQEKRKMAKENENGNQPGKETEAPAATVQNAEITRANDFAAFGKVFGEEDLARDLALKKDATIDDLREAIRTKRENAHVKVPPADLLDVARRSNNGVPVETATIIDRSGPLKAFKGANANRDALRAGHFLRAALYGDQRSLEYCRENGISLTRDHTGRNNAKGGVFVIPEIENAIIDLRIEYGVFRRNSHVVPMSSDTKLVNRRKGGLTAYAVGSGAGGTYSDTDWDQIELIARKWMVLTKTEAELEEDSIINFADMLVSEIAYAFTYAEDNAGFNGDGSGTYHGIVGVIEKLKGVDGTIANIKGLKVASGNAWSEIVEADLLGVVGLLPQFARKSGNVKWFCSHTFNATVLQRIQLAKGGVTYQETANGLVPMCLGYPVEIVEVLPVTEANSQIPCLFGNLAQASTLGDRRGVTIKMTDSNDKDFEKDLEAYKGTERFDINVHDVGDTTAAGPIVGLFTAAS